MKKVLALVLAVVMVCTMAMAFTPTTSVVIGGGTDAVAPTDTYERLTPGAKLIVHFENTVKFYNEGAGATAKFVPEKNTVSVTFSKGAEWVASQGWVQVNPDTANSVSFGGKHYEYQIVLKQDYTKAFNNKVCDLSISKVTLRADGYDTQTIFAETNTVKCAYGVGYLAADLGVEIAADGTVSVNPALATDTIYTIKSINDDGKPVNSITVGKKFPVGNGLVAEMPISVGQKVLYKTLTNLFTTDDTGYTVAGIADGGTAWGVNQFNTPVKVTYNQGKADAAKVYNVYAKDLSGKITKLAATLDRGVLTFNVPALSCFIITSDTVTASATETTPGTTTNPGTGANDVVGVAAALAVVALVSGAAISLKK